jgi:tRNA threonylcarbamoyladenosine dehydratase
MGEEIKLSFVPVCELQSPSEVSRKLGLPDDCESNDITDIALRELFEVILPQYKDAFSAEAYDLFLAEQNIEPSTYGNWVYYPWLNRLLRVPPKEHLQLLRTARNQLLIMPHEQKTLLTKTILIAGMSVGSNALEQLVHSGVGGTYVVADMDRIEVTNINRIQVGITSVGLPKVLSAARKALEVDPYLNVVMLKDGIEAKDIAHVFSSWNIDLIVDEVDDIGAKLALRQAAKSHKIPLVMATDNSDGAIIDIERYDINHEQGLFNNRIPGEILSKMISGELSREESGAAIGKYFVGFDLVDNRLVRSLMEVRRTIPSWPQLGTAASTSGVLVTYCAKIILGGGTLSALRFVADFDKQLNPMLNTEDYRKERDILLSKLTAKPGA